MVRYNQRVQKGPAVNKNISSKTVRVISEKGDMIGVLEREKALKLAFEQGLDLVEVSPMLHHLFVKLLTTENTNIRFKRNRPKLKKNKKLLK